VCLCGYVFLNLFMRECGSVRLGECVCLCECVFL
jgi:hypothetical protein